MTRNPKRQGREAIIGSEIAGMSSRVQRQESLRPEDGSRPPVAVGGSLKGPI